MPSVLTSLFIAQEPGAWFGKSGQFVVRFGDSQQNAEDIFFKVGDCMQISSKNYNLNQHDFAYFKIDGFKKIAINSVKNVYETTPIRPKNFNIFKIVGRLYIGKNEWREKKSSINYYTETGEISFTHNNRSRSINVMTAIKKCPPDSDKKYTKTIIDTIGDIDEQDTYMLDYKELITNVQRESYKNSITVSDGIKSKIFKEGDCIHFKKEADFVAPLRLTYSYIFKIKTIVTSYFSNEFSIYGNLLDDNATKEQNKLIWKDPEVFFQKNKDTDITMGWKDYTSMPTPTHIDWNTLDIERDECPTENDVQVINGRESDYDQSILQEDSLKNSVVEVSQEDSLKNSVVEVPQQQLQSKAINTIYPVSDQIVGLSVSKNSTTKKYNNNDYIFFENHIFKIKYINSNAELNGHYIDFIIEGYIWLEAENKWDTNVSYFYSINNKMFYITKLDHKIDWDTINLTENVRNPPTVNPIIESSYNMSEEEIEARKNPKFDLQDFQYRNEFNKRGPTKGGTFKKRHKMNKSRKHL